MTTLAELRERENNLRHQLLTMFADAPAIERRVKLGYIPESVLIAHEESITETEQKLEDVFDEIDGMTAAERVKAMRDREEARRQAYLDDPDHYADLRREDRTNSTRYDQEPEE